MIGHGRTEIFLTTKHALIKRGSITEKPNGNDLNKK